MVGDYDAPIDAAELTIVKKRLLEEGGTSKLGASKTGKRPIPEEVEMCMQHMSGKVQSSPNRRNRN